MPAGAELKALAQGAVDATSVTGPERAWLQAHVEELQALQGLPI
jgi:hypothetical protein